MTHQRTIELPKTPAGFGMNIGADGGVPSFVGAASVAEAHGVPVPCKVIAVNGVAVTSRDEIVGQLGRATGFGVGMVRHCFCLVCSAAFAAKTLPLPWVSAAFDCLCLVCSTAFAAKAAPFLAVLIRWRLRSRSTGRRPTVRAKQCPPMPTRLHRCRPASHPGRRRWPRRRRRRRLPPRHPTSSSLPRRRRPRCRSLPARRRWSRQRCTPAR